MADNLKSSGRSRVFSWVGLVFIGLPLLYVFSATPVFLILEKTHWLGPYVNWDYVRAFYTPLIWLEEKTFLKTPIDFYLKLLGIY